MGFAAAIVGDDLTGTLDAAAPFGARGISTVVALTPEDSGAALATGTAVVAVNTVSRAASPEEAAARVGHAARLLATAGPAVAFKKLDSRLKGNIVAETAAALWGFERDTGIVCPAIPDLGRIVEGGRLAGFGVEAPIEVASVFGASARRLVIPDTPDQASLDRIAVDLLAHSERALAIGARGLANALALRLSRLAPKQLVPFPLPRPVVMAVGSRDPITAEQIARLAPHLAEGAFAEAPNGDLPTVAIARELTLLRVRAGGTAEAAEIVAERFAASVRACLQQKVVGTLVLSGGDTAFSVLRALGVRFLRVEGEALPGIPWSVATIAGRPVVVLTKSGGLGAADALRILVEAGVAR